MLETNVELLIQTKIIHLLNSNDVSIRTIIHLCDYFDLPLKDFFDENVQYPPEYYLLLKEIQKLSAAKMNGLYVVLHQENHEGSQSDSDI